MTPFVAFQDAFDFIRSLPDNSVDLLLTDPPYMNVVKDSWDNQWADVKAYVDWMYKLLELAKPKLKENGSVVFFGGIGKHGERPFFKLLDKIEENNLYHYRNLITWGKRRAYGKSHDYLFCREEVVWYSVSPERTQVTFNIPLTDVKRGYDGYRKKIDVGTIELCYHPYSNEKISECACLSPESQARSKRDVLALLQTMAGIQGSNFSGQESGVQSKVLQPRNKQKSTTFKSATATGQQSCSVGFSESESSSQTKENSIHIDRTRLTKSLDEYVPCFGDINTSCIKKPRQPDLGGQGGQLCWVCTWKHTHNLTESKSNQEGCDSLGIGEACGLHAHCTKQRVVVTDRKVIHRAKSDFLRVTNVWTDIPELMRPERNTQKPLPLMERLVKTHTNPGDLVIDPFSGWGSTGVAALKLGRRFLGSERIQEDAIKANERCEQASVSKLPLPVPSVQQQQTETIGSEDGEIGLDTSEG